MTRELKHILVVVVVVCCAIFIRCANQLTPQGGPKDSLPPVLRSATPANGQRYFTGKRIFLDFNEYIQLKDQSKEFFSSPLMKTRPTLTIRKRGVRIDIKDTLRENQTYALNFGNAVQDNNEGNILYGLRYIFSTGAAIDSMLVTGYTADAMKGDSIGRAFIFFYDAVLDTIPEYDSLLFNREPSAVARAEGNGIFIAQNLKDIPYKMYAVQDNNGNQKYDPGVDKVGFTDSIVNPADMGSVAIWLDQYRRYPTADPQLYFRMFGETPSRQQNLTGTERPERHKAILRFSAPYPQIDTLVFDSIPEGRVIREYLTAARDTMALWFDAPSQALPDTIKGRISYMKTDSLGLLVPASQPLKLAWRHIETRDEQREREKQEKDRERAERDGEEYTPPEKPNPFKFKVDAGAEINPDKSIPIEFDIPLSQLDSARISLLKVPDLGDPAPVPFHVVQDTVNIRRWTVTADWDDELSYRLSIPAGVFVNVAGERNDSLGANFKIMQRAKFGTLTVNVTGKAPESKYILQVVNDKDTVERELANVSTGNYSIYYIPEGEVRLRITEDGNGNGKWDTGNLVERRQPERTEFHVWPSGDRFMAVKANWEAEANLDMATIFSPISIEKVRLDLQRAEDARVSKYLEEKAIRDAEKKSQQGQEGSGGLGIGGALGGAKQQIQSTVR